jgi:predicted site-specific integrase-resolvase
VKLSEYAKDNNIGYRAAWNRFKSGKITGAHKDEFGSITITKKDTRKDKTAVYARVSSSENKSNLKSQSERVQHFCEAKGWVVDKVVEECGSGLNDTRRLLLTLLRDKTITRVVVEHKDRLTRLGFNYLKELAHFEIVVINEVAEDEKDLMQDFVSLVTSFTARLYGRRRTKRATEKLIKEFEKC